MSPKGQRSLNINFMKKFFLQLLVGIIVAIFAYLLYQYHPINGTSPLPEITYQSPGYPLSHVIENIRNETEYKVDITPEAQSMIIYGSFEGDTWIDILRQIHKKHRDKFICLIDENQKVIKVSIKD